MTVPVRQNSNVTLAKKRREVFLKVLARNGKVIEAARAVGLADATSLYAARAEDEEFARQWDAAIEASADLLEQAAWDRAVDGVEEPILFKGEVVATKINYSDTLLVELLRARRPKDYRKPSQSVDVDVNIHAKVGIAMIPMTAASPDEWEKQAKAVHDQQKALPSFVDPNRVQDAQFTDVAPAASSPVEQPAAGTKEPNPGSFNREMGRS